MLLSTLSAKRASISHQQKAEIEQKTFHFHPLLPSEELPWALPLALAPTDDKKGEEGRTGLLVRSDGNGQYER